MSDAAGGGTEAARGGAAARAAVARARPRRGWRARLLLAAGTVLAALLAGEVALRVFGLAEPHPRTFVGEREDAADAGFVPDPEIGWRMPASAARELAIGGRKVWYHADAEGFRHDPKEAARGGPLIVVAGDSQVWGWGVAYEETFGARVGAALGGASVRNLGMPGFGLDQIWLAVKHCGLPRRPALVIAGVFRPDFERSLDAYRPWEGLNKPAFVLDGGTLRRQTAADRPGWVLRALERHSRVWTLGRNAALKLGRTHAVGAWWTLNAAILDALREDCARARVPLLFVEIPTKDRLDFPALREHLRAAGAAHLEPEAGTLRDEHFQPDGHLSVEGHRWLADAIAAWIRSHHPELAPERHRLDGTHRSDR